ncbi:MAG: hypothetical protein QM607_03430 [Microbacterium sp.]
MRVDLTSVQGVMSEHQRQRRVPMGFLDDAKAKAAELGDKLKDAAEDVKDKAEGVFEDVKDKLDGDDD